LPLGRFVDLERLRAVVLRPSAPPPAFVEVIKRGLDHLLIENLLWVIGAAIVTGIVVRAFAERPAGRRAAAFFHRGFDVLMRVLWWVVRAVPLAAFGVMAKVVGTSGLAIFPVLGLFVALVTLGIALQVFVWYALVLRFLARRSPGRFFALAGDAFGT